MKVNFDQLFTPDSGREIDPQLAHSALQLTSLNKSIRLNETIQTQEQTNIPHQQQPSCEPSYYEQNESIRQILQFKLALALQQQRYRSQQPPLVKALPRPTVDIKELSTRLHRHTPCDHDCCRDYELDKQIKEQAEQLWLKQHNLKYKAINAKQVEEQEALSERLHNHANYKKIKVLELKLKRERMEKEKYVRRRFSNQNYLTDYIPFYDRLESEVRKSREKQKLYQKDPFCVEQLKQPYFKPAKYNHKYQDVQSRYWQEPSQHKEGLSFYDQFSYSSLNTSQASVMSLDKSIQLVNSVEEYFIEKMRCIFLDKDKEYVTVGEDQITLMTQVEFRILQGFVMELEEGETRADEFQDKLRYFLEKLDFRDKQELRSHQTKARKAIMKKKSAKPTTLQTTKSSLSTRHHSQKPNKYLSKFENYV